MPDFNPSSPDQTPPPDEAMPSAVLFTAKDSPHVQPGDLVGDYRIVRELGQGGMGIVFLAEQSQLGRQVALKVMPPFMSASEAQVVKFRREAKSAARLTHPNIVAVHAVGEFRGTHYIAMEFVDGMDLAQEMRGRSESARQQGRTLHQSISPIERTVRMIVSLADALQYAHDEGVIHRDIKPQNILIDRNDIPKLTDFGLAKDLREVTLTQPGDVAGTPAYMSPEQARIRRVKVDHRTDVYSLGVVLYEMLTLQRPFEGKTHQEILHNISSRIPQPIRTLNRKIPRDLQTLCEKALEKNPERRFQTAGEFATELRRFLNLESISSRPASVARKVMRQLAAHRIAALLIAMLLSLAALGLMAARSRQQWLAQTAGLNVTSDVVGAKVLLRRYDAQTMLPGQAIQIGTTPLNGHRLQPGPYRVIVKADDGRFNEIEVAAFIPGQAFNLDTNLFRSTDVTDDGMMLIPAGEFEFGSDPAVRPGMAKQRLHLQAFWIDQCEVTNEQYKAFCQATGHAEPKWWAAGYQPEWNRLPVVGVKDSDAETYAKWCGKRLPTVHEWERGARGTNGLLHPWGPGPAPASAVPLVEWFRAYYISRKTEVGVAQYLARAQPVDSCPELRSLDGLYHMYGNVKEMTASFDPILGDARIDKGTNWCYPPNEFNLAHFISGPTGVFSSDTGFRCARSAAP